MVLASVNANAFGDSSFTVTLKGLTDLNAGVLQAIVSVNGVKSAATQVAAVTAVMPTVTTSATYKIAQNMGGNMIEIVGTRFGTDLINA